MLPAQVVQAALGIEELTYFVNSFPTFTQQIINGMNAVFAGVCDTVLAYHTVAVSPANSRAAVEDPFRTRSMGGGPGRPPSAWPDSLAFVPSYAACANRYSYEHDLRREHLGYVAINSRTNAMRNEHAVLREPDDDGRLPLGADGATAAVSACSTWTTRSTARTRSSSPPPSAPRTCPNKPVLIHSAVLGQTNNTVEENLPDLEHTADKPIVEALWARSELTLDDIDLFQPYDGFSFICLKWFESVGYCGVGEGGRLHRGQLGQGAEPDPDRGPRTRQHARRQPLRRRQPRAAVTSVKPSCNCRATQETTSTPTCKTALLGVGGFFPYTGGLILRTES